MLTRAGTMRRHHTRFRHNPGLRKAGADGVTPAKARKPERGDALLIHGQHVDSSQLKGWQKPKCVEYAPVPMFPVQSPNFQTERTRLNPSS